MLNTLCTGMMIPANMKIQSATAVIQWLYLSASGCNLKSKQEVKQTLLCFFRLKYNDEY